MTTMLKSIQKETDRIKKVTRSKQADIAHKIIWKCLKKKRLLNLRWSQYSLSPRIYEGKKQCTTSEDKVLTKYNEYQYRPFDFYCTEMDYGIRIGSKIVIGESEITVSADDVLNNSKKVIHLISKQILILKRKKEKENNSINGSKKDLQLIMIDNNGKVENNKKGNFKDNEIRTNNDQLKEFDELNDTELDELIGTSPSWLLRSGILIIGVATTLILVMSSVISYPDKIKANGIITTSNPPFKLEAPRDARIEKILVNTGDTVIPNQKLIYLNNTANSDDLTRLMNWTKNPSNLENHISPPKKLVLGNLHPLYSELILAFNEYSEVASEFSSYKHIDNIRSELDNINKLNAYISEEGFYYKREQELAKIDLERTKLLYNEDLISRQEYETAEANYNEFLRQGHGSRKNIVNNDIRINELKRLKYEIEEKRSSRLKSHKLKIGQIISRLDASYNDWEEENFIKSTIKGSVEISLEINNQAIIDLGQSLGYVIPEKQQQDKFIKAVAFADGIAKLDTNSRAIIKLDAYPYKEYGVIEANYNQLSIIPYMDKKDKLIYHIKIPLTDSLNTNYQDGLRYLPNMTASIDLITNNRSLFNRLFEQYSNLFSN